MVTHKPLSWLLLVYSVPRHPSAARVHIWRRLKQLGAEALQDATWALPATPRTEEHFRWLASEIRELRGTATVWEARLSSGGESRFRRRFEEPVERGYRQLIADARRGDAAGLARRFQQLQARDHFRSPLGAKARAALERRKSR